MNNFKLRITAIIFTLAILVSFVTPVFAQGNIEAVSVSPNIEAVSKPATAPIGVFKLQNPLQVDSIGGLVQSLVEILSYIAILAAVVMIIWVGFQYVVNAAKGNASEISKLHERLLWLIVGIAVVISAKFLIQMVINTIEATGTVDSRVINSTKKAINGN
jgi:hypothetical protein